MTNRGTPVRLVGERVLIYRNGVTWKNPETGAKDFIGRTRAEAIEHLTAWKQQRFSGVKPRVKQPLPTLDDGGKIPRHYWRALYYARSRARRANRPIMTTEEYRQMVEESGGRCAVTGIAFSTEKPRGHRKMMWSPSIDRIDNTKGYERDNCRLVCVAVNLALNEFGIEVLCKIADGLFRMPSSKLAATDPDEQEAPPKAASGAHGRSGPPPNRMSLPQEKP